MGSAGRAGGDFRRVRVLLAVRAQPGVRRGRPELRVRQRAADPGPGDRGAAMAGVLARPRLRRHRAGRAALGPAGQAEPADGLDVAGQHALPGQRTRLAHDRGGYAPAAHPAAHRAVADLRRLQRGILSAVCPRRWHRGIPGSRGADLPRFPPDRGNRLLRRAPRRRYGERGAHRGGVRPPAGADRRRAAVTRPDCPAARSASAGAHHDRATRAGCRRSTAAGAARTGQR